MTMTVLIVGCVLFDLLTTLFLLAILFPGSRINRLIASVESILMRAARRRRGTS